MAIAAHEAAASHFRDVWPVSIRSLHDAMASGSL
jgi:hypothetical protein